MNGRSENKSTTRKTVKQVSHKHRQDSHTSGIIDSNPEGAVYTTLGLKKQTIISEVEGIS